MVYVYVSKRNGLRVIGGVKEMHHFRDRKGHMWDVLMFYDGWVRHVQRDYWRLVCTHSERTLDDLKWL